MAQSLCLLWFLEGQVIIWNFVLLASYLSCQLAFHRMVKLLGIAVFTKTVPYYYNLYELISQTNHFLKTHSIKEFTHI